MAVNATHAEYDAALPAWLRARDVIAGEDAVKAAGAKYLPRLESQTDDEYAAYRARAAFFNASARTADGFAGLIFRRPPFIKLPETAEASGQKPAVKGQRAEVPSSALGRALAELGNDADMMGTPLVSYAKNVVHEVIAVGRAASLVDCEGGVEIRVYVSLYGAERIMNWCVERINGRPVLTSVVLSERADGRVKNEEGDEFEPAEIEQLRVLKLVPGEADPRSQAVPCACAVELWQRAEPKSRRAKPEWVLVDSRTPLRLGQPLPLIPFVFHGPRHALPSVDKLPLADVIAVNLDHYRLDADFKHGMHFTALPTAWVSGFDKTATLRIGASTAWVTETPGATAGFLEYTGQGLTTFERAMDRDERLMAVLGARLLESQKKVGETAQAIELRQSGENSILGTLAQSVSGSLTQVLRWCYWWNSTEELPDAVTKEQVVLELNTDFSTKGMSAPELVSVVNAWQSGALSRDTMLDLFRRGEILPDGRTNEEEARLIEQGARSLEPGGASAAPAT